MLAYMMDWLELVVRWIHVITGVSWIGASFYFNWLNNSLRPPETPSEGVDGEVWAVHGGHFYRVNKYAVAPPKLPKTLHWFKYEAYFTWISGIGLLGIVLLRRKALFYRPIRDAFEPWQAISIGIGTLLGWSDDQMGNVGDQTGAVFGIGIGLFTAAAYGLCLVLVAEVPICIWVPLWHDDYGECVLCDYSKSKVMVAQMSSGKFQTRV